MRMFFIVVGAALAGLVIVAVALWIGTSQYAKWEAEYGPELKIDDLARAQDANSKLKQATDEYGRWVALGDAALWNAQRLTAVEAEAAARELLGMLPAHQDDWNFGNAVHKANSALGRLALLNGDRVAARNYLLASAKTKGWPQMNTFGPNMLFAKEMLVAGEKDAVLEYLQLCGKFWEMERGKLAVWKRMIEEGRVPGFGANLIH